MSKTGLVLSGGGGKGAYQVGVMRALLEYDIQIDMISGASIGALNGAVLSSAPNLHIGTQRLNEMWQHISEIYPLQLDASNLQKKAYQFATYLTIMISAGLRLATPLGKAVTKTSELIHSEIFQSILKVADSVGISTTVLQDFLTNHDGLLSDKPLQEMMESFLDIDHLQKSIPLFVSIFKKSDTLSDLSGIFNAELFGIDNRHSDFVHLQNQPIALQKEILLASAAIPLLYQSRRDATGQDINDGGQGGWIKSQGNTPITPLVETGCDHVIVTHLSNGSLWHRHDFPDTTCIEIRPDPSLDLGLIDMFNFSKENILHLIDYGYEDTLKSLAKIKETTEALQQKRTVMNNIDKSISELDQSTQTMEDTMARLRSRKNRNG